MLYEFDKRSNRAMVIN